MTAKIVSILLALLTLISGTAAASFDPEADLQTQHGYILETVSYTHLDVYKRQV